MSWTLLGWAVLALANQPAYTQAAPDLSKDPRLQQTVDVHMKRALLPELAGYLKKHTDQRYSLAPEVEPLMVCVFARNQPLWLIMKDVAQVLGCEWKDVGSGWRLNFSKQDTKALADYIGREDTALSNDVYFRAKALAELTGTKSWSEVQQKGSESSSADRVDEPPDVWAARVIHDPAYYVAGLMFSRVPMVGHDSKKWDCPQDFLWCPEPVAYKLTPPKTLAIANSLQCGPAGSAAELDGKQILVRNWKWAGTPQAVLVDGQGRQAERPLHLLRYPRPVGDLAKTASGKYLLDWETPLDDPESPTLKTRVDKVELQPSPFSGGGRGIEEYLEALADTAGVPIVCDGFRMPTLAKNIALDQPTLRSWLETLRDSEKCFVRVEDNSVMVRHGGFWDLRSYEPTEELIRALEGVKNPGLDDYATSAYNQLLWHGKPTYGLEIPFYESRQVPLTRFDPKPLCDNYLALTAYGQMTEQQRVHILSGGSVDLHRNVVDRTSKVIDVQYRKDSKGKLVPIYNEREVKQQWGADQFLSASAKRGPFYGGQPTPMERRLLECTSFPCFYLQLWGASPDDDPDFVKSFGDVGLKFAYYLTVRDTAGGSIRVKPGEPRSLTGTFRFFASVSDSEGVYNDIVIPDTSRGGSGKS